MNIPCETTEASTTVLLPFENAIARASIGSCTDFARWFVPPDR